MGWKCFFVNTVVIWLIAATTTCQLLASEAGIDNAEIGPSFTIIRPEVIDESGRPLNELKGFGCGAPVLLADGRLMMVFGDDDKRFSFAHALFVAFSSDGGRKWINAKRIERNPDSELYHGRPAAVQTRDGTIWVFYYAWRKYDGTPDGSSSDVWAIASVDGGKSFANRRKIWSGYTGMLQGAVQTRAGHILVPTSFLAARQEFNAGCIVSTDGGVSWRYSSIVSIGNVDTGLRASTRLNGGALEPSIVELRDGRILMTLRTIVGRLYQCHSNDGGLTWSTPLPSDVSCGGTQYICRLASGRIAMVWNPADNMSKEVHNWPNGYATLSIAFSSDEGMTWSRPNVVARARNGTRFVHSLLFEPKPGHVLLTMPERTLFLSVLETELVNR